MNKNDAEMGERRAETGEQSSTSAAFPVSAFLRRRSGCHPGYTFDFPKQPGSAVARVFRSPLSQQASSLITTLLVLVVLSTIVVAFMQSMSVERNVAKSIANTYQAKLIADAAFDVALQRIQSIQRSGPYGAIFDLDTNGSPYLNLAKREIVGGGVVTRRIPLFSTAQSLASFTNLIAPQIDTASRTVSDLDAAGSIVTRNLSAASDLVCNMNAASSTFPNGLVGLMNGATPRALPVNWIYVNDSSGKIVGRYAFWTDDECSKVDLRFAGQAVNSSGSHSRGSGTNASDLSLLVFTNTPVNVGLSNIANLYAMRNVTNIERRSSFVQYPLPGGGNVLATNLWERIRPFVTVYSLNDDRSPDGKRKLDLNALVSSTNTGAQIQKEVFAIRDAITNNLPHFGTRYFSSPSIPTASEQQIYATRIAANIRDYIDTNSIATIIQSDDTAYSTNSPNFVPYEALDSDLPAAFGKERGPFLSEYFRIIRVISPDPHPATGATSVPIVIRFAHYIELQNPTGKTITAADLGPSPFVILSNRRLWNNTAVDGTPSVFRPADIKINLPSNFSIAPGGFAVLTTDGPPFGTLSVSSSQSGYFGQASNRFIITAGTGPGHWELINTGGKTIPLAGDYEDYSISTTPISSDRFGLQNGGSANPTYADQRERLLFGNADGLIDYTLRIFTDRGNYVGRNLRNPAWYSTFLSDDNTSSKNAPGDASTAARYTRGDVRSNTEASAILSSTSACWKEGSGAAYGTSLPAPQETLGTNNFNTDQNRTGVALWRQGWYEFTSDPSGNHFVANRRLVSIGELGSIYDPARYSLGGYRSQGATLRVGQSDSGTNNRANSTGQDYVNWLGGRGTDDVTSTNYLQNAFLLMDVFRTDDVTSGRVNPNSIVRDPAALAFRAVLDRFVFETATTNQSSSALSGAALNATNAISSLRSFATNSTNGFLVSAGDLSRAPLFWGATNALAGVSMQGVSDAGREEFMRRSANLLSTQSLAYSVFIRAESGSFVRDLSGVEKFRVKGTATRETVVQLQPMYAPVTDPTVTAAPTNWSIIKPRSLSY